LGRHLNNGSYASWIQVEVGQVEGLLCSQVVGLEVQSVKVNCRVVCHAAVVVAGWSGLFSISWQEARLLSWQLLHGVGIGAMGTDAADGLWHRVLLLLTSDDHVMGHIVSRQLFGGGRCCNGRQGVGALIESGS